MDDPGSSYRFLKLARHPVKFRMFLLFYLPAAFFSGVRIIHIDETKCAVSIPFKWLTRNPFRSTYFASLAMAAEMSTGALAMMHIHQKKPLISMLITNMQANYFKKATCKIIFECEDGKLIAQAIEETVVKNLPQSISVTSIGKNNDDDVVAEFIFTWSFKVKPNLK